MAKTSIINPPLTYQKTVIQSGEIEVKLEIGERVIKETFNIYNGTNEESLLVLLKEFNNMVSSNELWDNLAPKAIFYEFRRCLRDESRDSWDSIIEDQESDGDEEEWMTKEGFNAVLQTFVENTLTEGAGTRQKQYLRCTLKPRNMTVKNWITRVQFINTCLPWMEPNCSKFTEKELILEVITPNNPMAWHKDYYLAELNKKERLKEVLSKLLKYETVEEFMKKK